MLDENFIDALISGQYRSRRVYAFPAVVAVGVFVGGGGWLILYRHGSLVHDLSPLMGLALGLIPWKEIKTKSQTGRL